MTLRLVNAEFLKVRKRRGLLISAVALTVLPMVIAYAVLLGQSGPAGGMENFVGSMSVLPLLSVVAAILVGATVGTGDLGSGVFRELVVTGRSRWALFPARIPAGLALILPIVGAAFAITATGSIAFAGSEGPRTEHPEPGASITTLGYLAPSGSFILEAAGWLALVTAVSFMLSLGVSSLIGSRGTSIGILLGWWLVAMPILNGIGQLGSLRESFLYAALERLGPEGIVPADPAVPMSLAAAIVVLLAWMTAPLVAGAWRTATRDA